MTTKEISLTDRIPGNPIVKSNQVGQCNGRAFTLTVDFATLVGLGMAAVASLDWYKVTKLLPDRLEARVVVIVSLGIAVTGIVLRIFGFLSKTKPLKLDLKNLGLELNDDEVLNKAMSKISFLDKKNDEAENLEKDEKKKLKEEEKTTKPADLDAFYVKAKKYYADCIEKKIESGKKIIESLEKELTTENSLQETNIDVVNNAKIVERAYEEASKTVLGFEGLLDKIKKITVQKGESLIVKLDLLVNPLEEKDALSVGTDSEDEK